jgi:hypothetical protein
MSGEIFKRPYRIRRATIRGKEVTIPPEAQLQPGDEVSVYYDGFVLVVPRGVKVNENLLRQSMGVGHEGSEPTEGKT